jgi:hypothetical protein
LRKTTVQEERTQKDSICRTYVSQAFALEFGS